MNSYSTKISLRIDWSEMDLFAHVNNVAIIKYVQAARVNFLEKVGLMQSQYEDKVGPILASINCQFRKPLFYPGEITIYTSVGQMKNSSFELIHSIYDDQNELAADAKDIIVYYDFIKNKKLFIPQELKTRIQTLSNI